MTSTDGAAAAGRRRTYFQLQIAAQRVRSVADGLFERESGLTTAQAAALGLIAHAPGCSQRAVAGGLTQRESAVTATVRRLEAGGFVQRRVSSADARAWELWPTDAGLAAIGRLDGALAELNALLGAALGGVGVDAFTDALEALAAVRPADDRGSRGSAPPTQPST